MIIPPNAVFLATGRQGHLSVPAIENRKDYDDITMCPLPVILNNTQRIMPINIDYIGKTSSHRQRNPENLLSRRLPFNYIPKGLKCEY